MESQSSELRSEFADELRVLGVDCKGFGVIPKAVMTDPDLTAQAKAIYAYFASFTGAGTTAFPSRDRIVSDLAINKSTYYAHFELLVDNGYITVEQPHGRGEEGHNGFCRNIYTLVQNPEKFAETDEHGPAVLKGSGLKASGYGTIPKTVMIDRCLDLKAKALYAYLASFAGAGRVCCPTQQDASFHLNLSHNTLAKCLQALREFNYISVVQRRAESGQVGCCDYVLNDNPDLDESVTGHVFADIPEKKVERPSTKNSDTENEPITKKPYTQKPYTKKPYTQNSDTNINRLYNEQPKKEQPENNHLLNVMDDSIHPSCEDGRKEDATHAENKAKWRVVSDSSEIRGIIRAKGRIPYELTEDDETRTALVHQITEWETLCEKGNWPAEQSFEFEAYRLAAETLYSMLHPAFVRKIDGRYVNNRSILERVNRYIEPNWCAITEYVRAAARNYIRAAQGQTIKQPVRYMETCLWTALQEGNIREEAECAELTADGAWMLEKKASRNSENKRGFFNIDSTGTDYNSLAREAQRKFFDELEKASVEQSTVDAINDGDSR